MTPLKTRLTLDKETIESPNLVDRFDEEDLAAMSSWCWEGYQVDKQSRSKWESRNEAAMDLAMQIQKEKNFPWPNCYSLDTEILTETGWRYIDLVTTNDRVYSRDSKGVASFCEVIGTTRHPADQLVHFQGKSIDLLVTPNHTMILEDKLGRPHTLPAIEFVDKVVTYRYIPLTSLSLQEGPDYVYGIPVRAYLRFLGWYISEGNANYPRNVTQQEGFVGTTSSFSIAQSPIANPEKYAILKRDILACGFTCTETESGFTVHAKTMPEDIKNELRCLGKSYTKRIPRHVFKCKQEDLRELLDTLILGDGTTSKKNGQQAYFTSSKQLADDVQELCQYVGLRGTITLLPRAGTGSTIISRVDMYSVSINTKSLIQVAKLQRSLVPYAGDVACVETSPNHTLYVRRNGKALWCGNCSNVAFPLVTIGVMQFHARAYAAIVDGPNVAKYRVVTSDPTGEETRRAVRIGAHMSWQLLEQDTDWEEQHDRMLLNIAVVGCAFKKSYFSGSDNYIQSDLVMARDLVVNYWTKSIESAPRKTHLIPLHRNDIYTRVRKGMFKDILEEPWYQEPAHIPTSQERSQQDNRSGTTPPQPDSASPFIFLEMHCCCDLDQDGYAEPYIITLEE